MNTDSLHQAIALHQAGYPQQAVTLYQELLQREPHNSDVLHFLGLALYRIGDTALAFIHLERAIVLAPSISIYSYNLGHIYKERGQHQESISCFQRVLQIDPGHATAWYYLGGILEEQQQLDAAVEHYRKAIQFKPDYAEALNNLGNALVEKAVDLKLDFDLDNRETPQSLAEQGWFEEALEFLDRALALNPHFAAAHNNRGNALHGLGRTAEAITAYEQALALQPDSLEAHCNYASVLLLAGDLIQGWKEYEWRFKKMSTGVGELYKPQWDGSSLEDKTILLVSEQGLGDNIQFIRYAMLVKNLGARVLVETYAPLRALFATCPGVDEIFTRGQGLPEFDVWAPMMSLPSLLKTNLNNIPAQIPYLFPPKACSLEPALQKLLTTPNLKIGLVWSPKLKVAMDRKRYCPLRYFEPLLQMEHVQFFSLYKGDRIVELGPYQHLITDLGSYFQDFADTAYATDHLDLIISVDTSVVHVAGALGRPVWILLPFVPDWRWLLEREDSPWYPTARLFRPIRRGDWPEVLSRVACSLRQWVADQGV
ncbi:tetratricopeptide repeat protein [Anthocerotibacter panamensis]|uniref:tetratricopeptide repeat-containing glycosyltransferase family protein n=1 Tax=Anthocerotibacter panamensis TaxID=2857077 RepID=UPI001C406EB4|nr:tetratricopeptide repeat protein [Anthocerotibacter panamensis]